MTIKRPLHRISPEQYVKQFLEMESVHIKRVNQLNAAYSSQHSPYKEGQIVEIPQGKRVMIEGRPVSGYNVFMILMVRPRIIKLDSKQTISTTGEPTIKETYDIVFDLYGEMRGPEMPGYTGPLIFEPEPVKSDQLDKV